MLPEIHPVSGIGSLVGYLLRGQTVPNRLGNRVDRRLLTELRDLLVRGDSMQPHPLSHLAFHSKDRGNFSFGQEENLQHKMFSLLGPPTHSRLSHQDKARREDRFKCEYEVEKWKRGGIEVKEQPLRKHIPSDPSRDNRHVERYVTEASDKRGYPVAEPFGKSALGEEFLFVFGNEINVRLEMTMLGR